MRIRHLGHAALDITAQKTRLLIDPGGFSDADQITALTDLDAVFITHQHPDHVQPELVATVLTANPETPVHAEAQTIQKLLEDAATAGFSDRLHAFNPGDELTIGNVTVIGVGGLHAVIHPDIPRVHNVGLIVQPSAGRGPRLGVTGDSFEDAAAYSGIDALAFPVTAPWSKMRETIDFLREVKPRLALPVHDAIVSPEGRGIYMKQATDLAPDATEVRDWPEDRTVTLD